MSSPFADIRPYADEEVPGVIQRLLGNTEFLSALASLRLGSLASVLPNALTRPIVRRYLQRQLRGVQDVRGVQLIIEGYMDQMVARSTAGFTVSGLERLDPATPYLFMSNHRDIAMDPAFTNLALHRDRRETVRIAIGDNLLTKPWVSDLMRLNKSFIVKRSVSGPRELLAASKTLSRYIQFSLLEEQAPIWIAQREGRAKNGVDRTEPVIIKMLSMSRDKKTQSFSEHIASLRIVPVAISYELDPCDAAKAHELHQLATHGFYEKGAQEDVESIARGIEGDKGRVHVAFGTPLGEGFDSPEAVAAEVDRQILSSYQLHATNLYAYRRLHGDSASLPEVEPGSCSEAAFAARIDALPQAQREYALGIYANAVVARMRSENDQPLSLDAVELDSALAH